MTGLFMLLTAVFLASLGAVAGYLAATLNRQSPPCDGAIIAVLALVREFIEQRSGNMSEGSGMEELDASIQSVEEKVTGIGAKVGEESTQVRAEIQRLIDAINRGATRDQLLERANRLTASAGRLDQLGSDIQGIFEPEPVPAPPAEPPSG